MTFREKLELRIKNTGSRLCVGLDVRADKADEATKRFVIKVIEETAAYAAAFKPNAAYFESLGWQGVRMLAQILKVVPKDVPVIYDGKRGDIGETQSYYARAAFDEMGVDAVTLNPYMGAETLAPFLEHKDKGIYLLGVTSNPGAADIELQQLESGRRVYELVAEMTRASDQVGLVVGLTNAGADVLSSLPDVPLLVPGLGAQGGDVAALRQSVRQAPIVVNVSRGILYADEEKPLASKAKAWMDQINEGFPQA
jgi:orotidine 5'-phosphate decarboxylase subfamily 2